jgi:hypothetical protein
VLARKVMFLMPRVMFIGAAMNTLSLDATGVWEQAWRPRPFLYYIAAFYGQSVVEGDFSLWAENRDGRWRFRPHHVLIVHSGEGLRGT